MLQSSFETFVVVPGSLSSPFKSAAPDTSNLIISRFSNKRLVINRLRCFRKWIQGAVEMAGLSCASIMNVSHHHSTVEQTQRTQNYDRVIKVNTHTKCINVFRLLLRDLLLAGLLLGNLGNRSWSFVRNCWSMFLDALLSIVCLAKMWVWNVEGRHYRACGWSLGEKEGHGSQKCGLIAQPPMQNR